MPRVIQALEKVAPAPQRSTSNALQEQDQPIHDWYRFVLSYPPHLVRQYSELFGLARRSVLFDPFCGTGTTLVEGTKNTSRMLAAMHNRCPVS